MSTRANDCRSIIIVEEAGGVVTENSFDFGLGVKERHGVLVAAIKTK
jgi:hypothetical protein